MKISVIIPLYNKKDFILKALDSIWNQTYLPTEVIIVNDGSTDGSELLVEALHHPLVRLINQKNQGVSAARNEGVKYAKNDWVAFLDADDFWEINYLNTIKSLHLAYSTATLIATSYNYQHCTGKLFSLKLNKMNLSNGNDGLINNYFEIAACSNPPIWTSAVVVFKERLIQIGGFPYGVKSGEDLITWAKLALICDIAYSLNPLATFVLDPAHSYDSKPNRRPETPDLIGKELLRLYIENRSILGLNKYVAHWHKMQASVHLRLGNRGACIKQSILSLRFHLNQPKIFIYLALCAFPLAAVSYIFKISNRK